MAALFESRLPHRGSPVRERLFRYLVELELEKANRLRYCVSLICLTPDVLEAPASAALTRVIARIALRQLRRTDLATTLSPDVVALFLVDTEPAALARILDRVANARLPEGRRFVRGQEVVSVSGGASCYPVTAADGAALFREASDLMHRAKREGGDRLILPPLPTPGGN
jgi:GGDEF domain-containing protein